MQEDLLIGEEEFGHIILIGYLLELKDFWIMARE